MHVASDSFQMAYSLFVPASYDPSEKYPVVCAFHNAHSRGTNWRHLSDYDFAVVWVRDTWQSKYPCFVLAPQCPKEYRFVEHDWKEGSYELNSTPISAPIRETMVLLDSLIREFSIDTCRIYVTGISMGAFGAWDIAMRFPDRVAAAVPSGGCGDPTQAARIASVPVRAFHGASDVFVPFHCTVNMIEAIQEIEGSDAEYTLVPGDHGAAAKPYVDPEITSWLVDWVFSQKREPDSFTVILSRYRSVPFIQTPLRRLCAPLSPVSPSRLSDDGTLFFDIRGRQIVPGRVHFPLRHLLISEKRRRRE
jgi:predicted peptidase